MYRDVHLRSWAARLQVATLLWTSAECQWSGLNETETEMGWPTAVVSGLAQSPAMSMIGEHLRVTATELGRAVQDPDWAREFVEEV